MASVSLIFCDRSTTLRKKIYFVLVGGLNTLFGFLVYSMLVVFGFYSQISLVIATIIGVLFNYLSYGRIVFTGTEGKFVFLRFVLSYIAIYVVNAFLLHWFHIVVDGNPFVAQVLCIPFTVVLGWFLMNRWVFRG